MYNRIGATLKLENGLELKGWAFGYDCACDGELVVSTATVGYPEALTDPTYSGQILCMTYPLIGNYGIPDDSTDQWGILKHFESGKIHVRGLVITDYSEKYSHWEAVKSLDAWLKEQKIPGIFGIDTRELSRLTRENGNMLGIIVPESQQKDFPVLDPMKVNQVELVSCTEKITYGNGSKKIALVDCGVRNDLLRNLLDYDVQVIRVPWNYDFNEIEYDGVVISNGPGSPDFCHDTVRNIKKAMDSDKPVFGYGLGGELVCKAAGGQYFKLKSGHRSGNQPVRRAGTNSCYITSQNHSFAIDSSSLADWDTLYFNMNDGSCEGIRHKSKPFYAMEVSPIECAGYDGGFNVLKEYISKL